MYVPTASVCWTLYGLIWVIGGLFATVAFYWILWGIGAVGLFVVCYVLSVFISEKLEDWIDEVFLSGDES